MFCNADLTDIYKIKTPTLMLVFHTISNLSGFKNLSGLNIIDELYSSNKTSNIVIAASLILVPGPKTATAPASNKNW
jgi:hypothetical protein